MSNISFKGNNLHRYSLSGGTELFIPSDSLQRGYKITGHRHNNAIGISGHLRQVDW